MGKRQIRLQEKHSEGRSLIEASFSKVRTKVLAFLRGKKEDWEMTAAAFLSLMANAFDEDAKKCIEAGMNAHLTKPIEIDHVIEVLGQDCR